MAYALIAWQPPADGDAAEIEAAIIAALPAGPHQFLDRLILYPSPQLGVGFSTVRRRLSPVVRAHPGLELMIMMPDKGDTVGAWLDPAKGTFPLARPIMNEPGTENYPILIPPPPPPSGAGGP